MSSASAPQPPRMSRIRGPGHPMHAVSKGGAPVSTPHAARCTPHEVAPVPPMDPCDPPWHTASPACPLSPPTAGPPWTPAHVPPEAHPLLQVRPCCAQWQRSEPVIPLLVGPQGPCDGPVLAHRLATGRRRTRRNHRTRSSTRSRRSGPRNASPGRLARLFAATIHTNTSLLRPVGASLALQAGTGLGVLGVWHATPRPPSVLPSLP